MYLRSEFKFKVMDKCEVYGDAMLWVALIIRYLYMYMYMLNCTCILKNLIFLISGTHDSAGSSISIQNDISPDTSEEVKAAISFMGDCGKEIIYRWSVTQNLTITQQLNHGIRYFDLRVALHKKKGTFNYVHGLYGAEVKPILEEVNTFLDAHSQEVVILDFNHFYDMEESDHHKLLGIITDVFGAKLCPLLNMESVTLEMLWENQLQVLVFYQNDAVKENLQFWPANAIRSPWANTTNISDLMSFMDKHYKEGRVADIFYVWQGVLTPGTNTVLMHLCSSLKDCLCNKVPPLFVPWLKDKHIGKNGISICIMDFAESLEFIQTVISLNKWAMVFLWK